MPLLFAWSSLVGMLGDRVVAAMLIGAGPVVLISLWFLPDRTRQRRGSRRYKVRVRRLSSDALPG